MLLIDLQENTLLQELEWADSQISEMLSILKELFGYLEKGNFSAELVEAIQEEYSDYLSDGMQQLLLYAFLQHEPNIVYQDNNADILLTSKYVMQLSNKHQDIPLTREQEQNLSTWSDLHTQSLQNDHDAHAWVMQHECEDSNP